MHILWLLWMSPLGLACLKPSEMASFIVLPSALTSATKYGAYFLRVMAGARSYSALHQAIVHHSSRILSTAHSSRAHALAFQGLSHTSCLFPRSS